MAVTLGNTTSQGSSSATSLTQAHTIASDTDSMLAVLIYNRNRVMSTITYDGDAMTTETSNTAYQGYIYLCYKVAPSSGANNIISSVSGGTSSMWVAGIDFSDVDQSAPFDDSANSSGYGSSQSVSVTTVDANTYIVGAGSIELASTTQTATTGQTEWGDIDIGGQRAAAGYEAITSPGSESMGWGNSSGIRLTVAGAIAEAQAVGPVNIKSRDGLAKASIKSVNGLAIASVKSINGLE